VTSMASENFKRLRGVHALVFVILMAFSWGLSVYLTPHQHLSELNRDIQLETIIPVQFSGWRVDESQANAVVNPQQLDLLKVLYSQNLGRVYVNERGQRIMLSIAYGAAQEGALELHRPEVCYVAQGASIERQLPSPLISIEANQPIELQHLVATNPRYREPITYWMRVGNEVMPSGSGQQLSRVRQGLKGWVPDGILFRVSSIEPLSTTQFDAAYGLHQQFVHDLFAALPKRAQQFLVGPIRSNL
jgi:EpsI family protein